MPTAVYGFVLLRVAVCPRPARFLVGVPVRLFKNGNNVRPAGSMQCCSRTSALALPFPNVDDHAIDCVIAALARAA